MMKTSIVNNNGISDNIWIDCISNFESIVELILELELTLNIGLIIANGTAPTHKITDLDLQEDQWLKLHN